jgi:Tol biopolymer transport system component
MDIFVADSAGVSNPVEITNDAYEDIMPQFSPDGKRVVFASLRPTPGNSTDEWQWQIAIMNADGSGTEQILPIPPGIVYQMAQPSHRTGSRSQLKPLATLMRGPPFREYC